jgi:hypothetical protein
MNVLISPIAGTDLQNIANKIATDSADQAAQWSLMMREKIT